MKKQIYKHLVLVSGLALGSLPLFSQTHNLDFKVRELTHGTGANISGVKIELDDGKYIGFSDANGVAHIPSVNDGTHKINIAKQGYIQFVQDGYTISSDKTFNASILSKVRTIPAGTDTFNVSWWRQTYANVGMTMRNKDAPRWAQIAPINNRISPTPAYTQADSLGIVAAINEIETKTGYDLIKLVPNTTSPDTTYTLYTHSSNYSEVNFLNGIIFTGYSGFSVSTPTKRVIHEIVKQFDMWPIASSAYVSVMEPNVSTMANMQVWDADNIAVTFDEHYAKQRGEQDLFLGNMEEYVTPVTPAATSITLPINNATDLEKIVRFIYNNSAGTDKYHMDIATDNLFTNMVQDLMIYRTDTLITLSNDQQYYARVQATNTAGNSSWSSTIAFHTSFPTGLKDISAKKQFTVYPNPFSDFISITSADNKSTVFKIEFFTSDGRLVKYLTTTNGKIINLSDLRLGSYFLRISNIGNSIPSETLTLIKQ